MESKKDIKHIRPSWDEYFLELIEVISKRATCNRGRAGCVIVKDRQILATGYVGSAKGLPHCDDVGHLMRKVLNEDGSVSEHCVRTIHAEQNAIIRAALNGVSVKGSTMYCTHEPCIICAKMIVNSGIKRVVTYGDYPSEDSLALFKEAGIKFDRIKRPNSKVEFLD